MYPADNPACNTLISKGVLHLLSITAATLDPLVGGDSLTFAGNIRKDPWSESLSDTHTLLRLAG